MIHISQSEILLVCLVLFNSMCLHDMVCGSLGVIKFDIKLVVSYFFKNLLLLILKRIKRYLGLPLIGILLFFLPQAWKLRGIRGESKIHSFMGQI